MGNLSARAIASELGVSHTAVNKAASSGRIEREPDGGFDLQKVLAAWNVNVNIHQQARGAGSRREAPPPAGVDEPVRRAPRQQQCRPNDDDGDDESKFSTAKIQKLNELEKLAERRRENAKAAGNLLDRAEALGAFASIGKIYAAGRDALPTQLATKLVGLLDLDEIERIIRTALLEADSRICNEIDSRFPHLGGSANGDTSGS